MYIIRKKTKYLNQIELDSKKDVDLIRRIFNKLMVWTDPPIYEPILEGDDIFAFTAYTTEINIIHMFDLVGIRTNPYSEKEPVFNKAYRKDIVRRLYIDHKFIKKKMHRKNYLNQFADNSKDEFRNFKKYIKWRGADWIYPLNYYTGEAVPDTNVIVVRDSKQSGIDGNYYNLQVTSSPNQYITNIKGLYSYARKHPDIIFKIPYTTFPNERMKNGFITKQFQSFFKKACSIPMNIYFSEKWAKYIDK